MARIIQKDGDTVPFVQKSYDDLWRPVVILPKKKVRSMPRHTLPLWGQELFTCRKEEGAKAFPVEHTRLHPTAKTKDEKARQFPRGA